MSLLRTPLPRTIPECLQVSILMLDPTVDLDRPTTAKLTSSPQLPPRSSGIPPWRPISHPTDTTHTTATALTAVATISLLSPPTRCREVTPMTRARTTITRTVTRSAPDRTPLSPPHPPRRPSLTTRSPPPPTTLHSPRLHIHRVCDLIVTMGVATISRPSATCLSPTPPHLHRWSHNI